MALDISARGRGFQVRKHANVHFDVQRLIMAPSTRRAKAAVFVPCQSFIAIASARLEARLL